MDIRLIIISIVMGIPTAILTWILIRIAIIYINTLKRSKLKGEVPKIQYVKLGLIGSCIAILFFLVLFLLTPILAPSIVCSIPIVIRMLIVAMILVIYSCFAAFFLGLRNVVGAGGSAGKVVKTLSGYIQEAINITDTKDQSNNQPNSSEGKNGKGEVLIKKDT